MTAACTHCSSTPCRCIYKPVGPPVVTLSDDDIERIAQRVAELVGAKREEKSGGAE